jgi:nitronate monooxygenase
MKTRITELFSIQYPLVLAPMTGTATSALVAAVSSAGGLGMLGTALQGSAWLETQVREIRAMTAAPFGIGFIQWAIELDPGMFNTALSLQPHAVSLSFGAPEKYIEKAKMAGIRVIYQAQTVDLARRAAAAGADAVVAQGTEAGGHTGRVSTLPLVVATVDAVSPVPVIAAGGIAEGRGIAAMLMLGAEGVWLGTRFVASVEAQAHANAKQQVLQSGVADTVLTHVYDILQGGHWPDEFAGRALRNRFLGQWHGQEAALSASLEDEGRRVAAAQAAGDVEVGVVYAGEASGLINEVLPARQIVRNLFADAEAVLRRRPGALLEKSI